MFCVVVVVLFKVWRKNNFLLSKLWKFTGLRGKMKKNNYILNCSKKTIKEMELKVSLMFTTKMLYCVDQGFIRSLT